MLHNFLEKCHHVECRAMHVLFTGVAQYIKLLIKAPFRDQPR